MSIIADLLIERAIADTTDIDTIREAAIDRAHGDAENLNIYYSHALDNLSMYRKFEPDPAEVSEYLSVEDRGDWRKAMTVAAILATEGYLMEQVESDLSGLQEAFDEAESKGLELEAVHAECIYGWAAHQSEEDWKSGQLLRWANLEGGGDRYLLRVEQSGDREIWLELKAEAAIQS